ncbi:hypothetical protein I6J04_05765 [Staphylococcus carnosus]|uniref:Uncharacterized protein n=1 Tax=Staphylococcus carnosus TaxID=1281 RepID=A0AAJ0JP80_STACA|nr:hypothetical protein [Staphylococcus carnosus]KKB25473.1 hypothetical protein VV61_05010 [Staphylococcus carnosus]POA04691.1 hypothetical protein CD153_03650 [Staphylococcus carnosus]QQS86265.1 hypothetical protein I6J04_05765 [Staphylococcus carnosus]QRQ06200.1 hypothetical protein I6J34_06095 [Staphylococcus carnosus]UTB81806.1 hypothetical protein A2I67_00105 [Staphylococcus carnosus]
MDEHTQLKGDTVVIVTATDKADNQSLNTEAIVENIITPIPDNAEKTPEAVEEPNESDEIEEDTWGLIDGKGNAEAIKNSNLDYEFNDTKTEESTDDCDIEETEKEESDKVVAPLPESEDKALEVPTDQTKDEESHESNGATVNRWVLKQAVRTFQ